MGRLFEELSRLLDESKALLGAIDDGEVEAAVLLSWVERRDAALRRAHTAACDTGLDESHRPLLQALLGINAELAIAVEKQRDALRHSADTQRLHRRAWDAYAQNDAGLDPTLTEI